MQLFFILICAYLFGSFPTGKLMGAYHKIDIQKHGSGNIGFANVMRVIGWKAGLVVLIADILKGAIPLVIARNYAGINHFELMIVGLMPIIGHAYSIFLDFSGGKSIATGLGVLLVIEPRLAICGVLIYCFTFLVSKRSDVSSLIAVWLLTPLSVVFKLQYGIYFVVLAIFASYTHRRNIREILKPHVN